MSGYSSEAIGALVDQVLETDSAVLQASFLEEAIRLSDSDNEIDQSYRLRMWLIEIANFGNLLDKTFVAFSWCLAQSDKYPGRFSLGSLLWRYKWMISNCTSYFSIPKSKIREMTRDFEQRLDANGYNKRPVYFLNCRVSQAMGDFEQLKLDLEQWQQTTRDSMSDCLACETNKMAAFQSSFGDHEAALQTIVPLVEYEQTCRVVPEVTFGNALYYYWNLNRLDEMLARQREWYPEIQGNFDVFSSVLDHLLVVAASGDLDVALGIYKAHAYWIDDVQDQSTLFDFYKACEVFFAKLAATKGDDFELRAPAVFTIAVEGVAAVGPLREFCRQQAEYLADKFDQRNGNSHFKQRLAGTARLVAMFD